ncbi:MAG: amidase [Alphaproteobacteria bacterium]|nr:amidase [Alphaproteobacteria bacterium]
MTAVEVVGLLKQRKVSPLELIDVAAARIAEVDKTVNALPTLFLDRAREQAKRIDTLPEAEKNYAGYLAGLPIAVKDLNPVKGVLTTYGSPIYKDFVPGYSDHMVDTLDRRGAVTIAKSNTPEFGAGANTFNEVFGATVNPWDTRKSCAGSSGGAAVALATGQVWLATGSDLGGSLRTPASFCGVVGLRPSPGRVAHGPGMLPFGNMSVDGPMGRNVGDVALFLDAMVGQHPDDPISLVEPATSYSAAIANPGKLGRVAFSADLGGITPVDPEVRAIVTAAAKLFETLGATVEEASPDLRHASETFQVLRAAQFAASKAPLLETHRALLKPEVIWNIEKGQKLTAEEIGQAERWRGEMYHGMVKFFETYDVLVCPTAIVPPYPIEQRYVEEVDGHRFDNYIDWVLICAAITNTSCPAISVPCGFTKDGLPIGLQIVGKPRDEAGLLRAARLFEQAAGLSLLPIDPVVK